MSSNLVVMGSNATGAGHKQPGSDFQTSIPSLLADLTYSNYVWNRQSSPEIPAEKWEMVYGPDAIAFEQRLQRVTHNLIHATAMVCAGAQSTLYCGKPTVKCPRCNRLSDNCADHLWEEKTGEKVCVMCWNID